MTAALVAAYSEQENFAAWPLIEAMLTTDPAECSSNSAAYFVSSQMLRTFGVEQLVKILLGRSIEGMRQWYPPQLTSVSSTKAALRGGDESLEVVQAREISRMSCHIITRGNHVVYNGQQVAGRAVVASMCAPLAAKTSTMTRPIKPAAPVAIPEAFSVKGQAVIVTGAAGFIGRVIVEVFAANGARVLATDRATSDLSSVVNDMVATGYDVAAHPADLTALDDLKGLIAAAESRFGRLDTLVNCGGIPLSHPLDRSTEQDFDKLFHTNVRSIWLLTKYAAELLEHSAGSVVNIASINGHAAKFSCSLYAATKAAVIMMTRELAAELGPRGIRINSVSPGAITSPEHQVNSLARKLHEPFASRYREMFYERIAGHGGVQQPLPVGGRPIDVAYAVVYLASPAARFVSSADILVDGAKHFMLEHQHQQREDDLWKDMRAYLNALPAEAWKDPPPHWVGRK